MKRGSRGLVCIEGKATLSFLFIEGEKVARETQAIISNLCLIEDEKGRVAMQYREPGRAWAGWAFPGGHIEKGESIHQSVLREIEEETGLKLLDARMVAIKDWEDQDGTRIMVFCYKATQFEGQLQSSDEGKVCWIDKAKIPDMDLAYDMEFSYQIMEDPNLFEFYYQTFEDGSWERKFYR